MAKWFFGNGKDSHVVIVIDPNISESYVCASLAEELEEEFEIEIDKNGEYYINFFFQKDQEYIQKDLTIVDDDDCQYDLCLGQDFLGSNQVFDFTEDQLLIESPELYEPLAINLFDY